MFEWIVQTYLNVPALLKVFVNVKPFLEDVADPAAPLAGVTLCGTPPCVHLKVTLSPFLMLTELGENELFFTATVFVEPACAGTAATAKAVTATATSLRIMERSFGLPTNPDASSAALFHRPMSLKGKTMFISGGSRGIGLQIALTAARDGANVALIAKTAEPHPKLPGTIYTAAEELEAAGGQALPIVGDIRDADQVAKAVEQTVERFGGIDICVNNASAINLSKTSDLPVRRFDLMQEINARGTYVVTHACLPHLVNGTNPHILTLSPPISLEPRWLGGHIGYTLSKYGMSLLALGWAEELREAGVASNALWPRTLIATAAVQNLLGGDQAMAVSRKPELYADAAYAVLNRDSRTCTGNTYLCEDVLKEEGVTDFEQYAYVRRLNPAGRPLRRHI